MQIFMPFSFANSFELNFENKWYFNFSFSKTRIILFSILLDIETVFLGFVFVKSLIL